MVGPTIVVAWRLSCGIGPINRSQRYNFAAREHDLTRGLAIPTHRELPDRELRPSRRNRRSWHGLTWSHVPLLVLIVIAVPVAGVLLHPGSTNTATIASGANATTQTHSAPAPSRGRSAPRRMLARGVSAPSAGKAPKLLAVAHGTSIKISSHSPEPVSVSVSNGRGNPFHHWGTLRTGAFGSQGIVTERSYGYCFAQPAGAGYAATRACGTLIMHSYVNGVPTPGGEDVQLTISFVRTT